MNDKIVELCKNYSKERLESTIKELSKIYDTRYKVSYPTDVIPHINFRNAKQEVFAVAFLDGGHNIIKIKKITQGLLNRTLMHPREVFAPVLKARCASIILIHNHPSGSLEPSQEDRDCTERLVKSGELLGVKVLDHVIVTPLSYYSFAANDDI